MSIFVSIACFMDKDIINTVNSCVKNAKYPKNINFGICLQQDPEDDWNIEKLSQNISIKKINWKDAKGPTHARYLCNQLIKNEKYFLQIDCHTHFVKNWDQKIINMWNECVEKNGNNKVILSMFPASMKHKDNMETYPTNVSTKKFVKLDINSIKLGSVQCGRSDPLKTYYLSGAFIFGPTIFTKQVPYDPILTYSYQSIEQQFYAIRLYTHGWDMYKPSNHILCTSYVRSKHFDKNGKRVFAPSNTKRNKLSWDRVLYYYGIKKLSELDNIIKKDIYKYGLGKQRTLQSFFEIHNEPNWKKKIYPNKYTFQSKNHILNSILLNHPEFLKTYGDKTDFVWDYYNKNKDVILHNYSVKDVMFIDDKKELFKLIENCGIVKGIPKNYFSVKDVKVNKRMFLKYAGNNGGKNVFLYDNIKDLETHIKKNTRPYIIQEEVYPISLLEGKKYILRNWVVIINDMFFLCNNGTCILHGDLYDEKSLDRSINIEHLQDKIKFVKYEETEFYNNSFQKVIKLLSTLCNKCIKNKINLNTNSFQVLGTDIIFDNTYEPYLIEINSWPNMSAKNVRDSNFFNYFIDELVLPQLKLETKLTPHFTIL